MGGTYTSVDLPKEFVITLPRAKRVVALHAGFLRLARSMKKCRLLGRLQRSALIDVNLIRVSHIVRHTDAHVGSLDGIGGLAGSPEGCLAEHGGLVHHM